MTDGIILSPGVALAVIAFLLSLLPAGFFVWLWYLRRRDRALHPSAVAGAFGAGMLLVLPAFWLEDLIGTLWETFFPVTAHYFAEAPIPLLSWQDILLPALATFIGVATIEEGLRYALLRGWLRLGKKSIDQVFDGLLIGVAVGVGFATLENTLYFLNLFREGHYETLVFVFFLRFLVSTLAHISFSGIMGVLLARDAFEFLSGKRLAVTAFLIPWLLHGMFDWMLAVHLGLYAVLLLLPPLLTLMYWASSPASFIIHRRRGKLLPAGEFKQTRENKTVAALLKRLDSPWNAQAPWLGTSASIRINTPNEEP